MSKPIIRRVAIALGAVTTLALVVVGSGATYAGTGANHTLACNQRGAGNEHQSVSFGRS